MTGADGKWSHSFASGNDLWKWTYMLVMDQVDAALALQSSGVIA